MTTSAEYASGWRWIDHLRAVKQAAYGRLTTLAALPFTAGWIEWLNLLEVLADQHARRTNSRFTRLRTNGCLP